MDRLFIDTNVLLDVLEKRVPWYPDAVECLTRINDKRCCGAITALSLSDISYIQRKETGEKLCEVFRSLREFLDIAPVDATCIDLALSEAWSDIEDSFQWHAAKAWKSTHFITRNVRDFPDTDTLKVLTPNEYSTANQRE